MDKTETVNFCVNIVATSWRVGSKLAHKCRRVKMLLTV